MKKEYTQPLLVLHGDIEVITQSSYVGGQTDAAFTSGIPVIPGTSLIAS